MYFEHPYFLLLIFISPIFLLIPYVANHGVFSKKNLVIIFLKIVFFILIVISLSSPNLKINKKDYFAIYAIDFSESISEDFFNQSINYISNNIEEDYIKKYKIIVFSKNILQFDSLNELKNYQTPDLLELKKEVDRSQTNIEKVVNLSAALFNEKKYINRIILFSDGRETNGNAIKTVRNTFPNKYKLYSISPKPSDKKESWISNIDLPEIIRVGDFFDAEISVYSNFVGQATIFLDFEDQKITKDVKLKKGFNSYIVSLKSSKIGTNPIDAKIIAKGDNQSSNNKFVKFIDVSSEPSILLFGEKKETIHLNNLLKKNGMKVKMVDIDSFSFEKNNLRKYNAVFFTNIQSSKISDTKYEAIKNYVVNFGGTLFLTGGDNLYGKSNYSDHKINEILPVKFESKKIIDDLAIVLAIDRSYSMKGIQMQYAKEAALATLDLLKEQHKLGVVAFDSRPYIYVPLKMVRSKRRAEDKISRIRASGQTNIYPALGIIYRLLQKEKASKKHVILLSDGDTHPADFQKIIDRMKEADISISTVTIGLKGNPSLMEKIAEFGGGKNYIATDIKSLPQLFIEETNRAVGKSFSEEKIKVNLRNKTRSLNNINFADAPKLNGKISMKEKSTAEVLLQADDFSPLLAKWQYGAGKVFVFGSDVTNRWGAEWISWDENQKFWAQLIRNNLNSLSHDQIKLGYDFNDDVLSLKLDFFDENYDYKNNLRPKISVNFDGNNINKIIELEQDSLGSYVTEIDMAMHKKITFSIIPSNTITEETVKIFGKRVISKNFIKELRFLPPNIKFLNKVSEMTGGELTYSEDVIFRQKKDYETVDLNISKYIVLLAFMLYLIEIFIRRTRLFNTNT